MDKKKNYSLVKNAADEKQVERARKTQKLKREQHLHDLFVILSTREGRRVLFWIVNGLCHYDADDFNNSGSVTYYNLGERNIGRNLKSDCIEASYELWQLAERENWEFLKTQGDNNE